MKISIVTITYNSSKTLEETIQSVIKQDYDDIEYIIVDGGSKDGTLDIIKKYQNEIAKWISEPDKGISDAFNKGVAMATGEVIGIINSDDMLIPNSLLHIAEAFKENVDVVYGNSIVFGGDEPEYRYRACQDLEKLRLSMSISHPSVFVKKKAYETYGCFDIQYRCQMDRELLLRMYLNGARFEYVDRDLTKVRLGGMNQSTYLKITIPEGKQISIRYGLSPITANMIAFRNSLRFIVAGLVRKLPFAGAIRKVFHSKSTDLNVK